MRVLLTASAPASATTSSVDETLWKRGIGFLPTPLPATDTAIFQPTPIGFRLGVTTGRRETGAVFFPADQSIIDNPSPQKLSPTKDGLVLELKKDSNLQTNPAQLKGVLELADGRNYVLTAMPGTVAAPPAAPAVSIAQIFRAAGLAFVGGMLLNLMPCVFPVLFLKGLALVQSGSEERHEFRRHGFVYTAGILVSFWLLVGLLLMLRSAGAGLGWGFQFQSPVFLMLMAGLLFFLGLSLAGQFEIGLTLTSTGGSLIGKQGYAGSFFTGVLAVIVATPCTAPFMGAALGYAIGAPVAVTFAVFTALALGLAAPYVALTLQPAWTRFLPRPGAWMEVLKQAVSVPIFATVIWLAWVVTSGYGAELLAALLCSLLLLAVAGWFLGRWPARRWATVVAVLIVAGVVALSLFGQKLAGEQPVTANQGNATTQNAAAGSWSSWSADAVQKSLATGQPVFVDFTASWCLSCQVNERVALSRPEVMQAFAARNVALFRADWTREDPAITQALTDLGRSGVPVYALYTPGKSDPVLLPQVLTPGIVTDAINSLPATPAAAGTSNGQ
jgi:thiol:disulfide interchange protein DsbD